MNKFLIFLILIVLPGSAIAQSSATGDLPQGGGTIPDAAGESEQGAAPNEVTLPGNPVETQPSTETPANELKITVTGKNKRTGRILGGIKVSITNAEGNGEATTPDPPNPDGDSIMKATPGVYNLTATRAGYKDLSEQTTLQGTDLKLDLLLDPISSTPSPETEYATRLELMRYAASNSPSYQQYPYNQTGTYPNSGTSTPNSPYYGQQNYSQNNYSLTSNTQAVIPLVATFQSANMLTVSNSLNVQIIDPQTSSTINLLDSNYAGRQTNLSVYTQVNRYGCLKPNQSYILRVTNPNAYSSSATPYQEYRFTSADIGGYSQLTLQEQQIGLSFAGPNPVTTTPEVRNLALSGAQIPINCPSGYNSQTQLPNWGTNGNNGTTTWTDQTFSPASFGNYHVEKPDFREGYFLVSNVNYMDARQITFVESISGEGGLAFVPAQSGNFAGSYSSSDWYVTTYTRNIKQQLANCKTYLNTLSKLAQFSQLTPTVQTELTNVITTLSQTEDREIKQNLTLCYQTKNTLVDTYQKFGANVPAMTESKTTVNLNLTKLTRVNFSPKEYQDTIAGETLLDFK